MAKAYDKNEMKDCLKTAYTVIDEKFGFDIAMLDISDVSTVSDYFIIASANSPNQLKSIADAVGEALHKKGIRLVSSEGTPESRWLLLNFGGLIVHLFYKQDREHYNLEGLWNGAAVILPEHLA
jgi:ribosome-associated protein